MWLWWLFDKFSCLEPAVCTVGACDFFFWWQYLTVECVSQFCRLTRKHSVRLLVWGMTRTCWWNQSKIDCKMRYYSACTLLSSYIFFLLLHSWSDYLLYVQATVAYYLLLDNRLRTTSGYLGAECQEAMVSSWIMLFLYPSILQLPLSMHVLACLLLTLVIWILLIFCFNFLAHRTHPQAWHHMKHQVLHVGIGSKYLWSLQLAQDHIFLLRGNGLLGFR